jgi:hypothetical protein
MNSEFLPQKGEIVIYQGKNHRVQLEVKLEKETVWLTQKQIAILFHIQRPAFQHLQQATFMPPI